MGTTLHLRRQAITLEQARRKADNARAGVLKGINPNDLKKAEKAAKKLTLENEKLKGKGLFRACGASVVCFYRAFD
jgi:hypothetical protein